MNTNFEPSIPANERILDYAPGSTERADLKRELEKQSGEIVEIPLIIGGREVKTDNLGNCIMPHDHGHILARYHIARQNELEAAIDAALKAKEKWMSLPFVHRASIFKKAADLISGPYRSKMIAATMLNQSKTVHQAQIDCVCELSDFLRFNACFAGDIFKDQPISPPGVINRMEYRPLDGFVAAVTPFNFTAIGGNLPSAPALFGNTVLWKPASSSVLSNYYVMRAFIEAGLPAGVINFVPCRGGDMSRFVLANRKLGGFHFTGSTEVFQDVWKQIAANIGNYESYPRLVGETGGKDFVFAHKSAETGPLTAALILGAFEYQGQKCSAASRAFIPKSLWGEMKVRLLDEVSKIKTGDVRDFTNLCGAVIDKRAFDRIKAYIEYARSSPNASILAGGDCDDSKGYFIKPTVIEADSPAFKTMVEEIFGPVLTIYVYDDDKLDETLEACDKATPYALTGSIFASDRYAIKYMEIKLVHSAGNFYINDKPTGAVVGQQPFGGGRTSGTNDKAGSKINLYRWTSPRSVKESLVPSSRIAFPFMEEE
ncbi:MAG: 1-pyrroline-5-carboxylate dehydrogenase 1 [Firmicutes bacterium ADurb.Bin182]|nr:MAG: 1-pyrroline-5-carboxylate dehydrogenase 1 [Firmicutes bacterium ADurb.Bin182]